MLAPQRRSNVAARHAATSGRGMPRQEFLRCAATASCVAPLQRCDLFFMCLCVRAYLGFLSFERSSSQKFAC